MNQSSRASLEIHQISFAWRRHLYLTVHMNCMTPQPDAVKQRITDLENHQRPREKLMNLGACALSDDEILALFIATGTRGQNAIDISRAIIRKHGSMGAIGAMNVMDLAKEHGIGIAKASRLIAAFELGSRVARERIHLETLDSPNRIYHSFAPQIQHLPHETVMVAALDCRLRHLSSQTISVGSVNESIAHPRDILRPVIARGAHGFILIHNHPSGDPSPSRADLEVTRLVADASKLMQLRFVDHIIIGRECSGRDAWFSFREAGRIIDECVDFHFHDR